MRVMILFSVFFLPLSSSTVVGNGFVYTFPKMRVQKGAPDLSII